MRSASGPPYLAGAPDANLIRITQAPDYIAIVQEKYHETRVIALNGGPRRSPAIRTWTGESRARWDVDTLVVETVGFPRQLQLAARFDENLRFVERFALVGPKTLVYEFTVDNPTYFTAPWTVRLPMTRTGEELYRVRMPRRELLAHEHASRCSFRRAHQQRTVIMALSSSTSSLKVRSLVGLALAS